MTSTENIPASSLRLLLMLDELGVPVYRVGYRQLQMAIIQYSQDDTQSLTKQIYPSIAAYWGGSDVRSVDRAIHLAIVDAWNNRDPETWEHYFPGAQTPPSNKQFIATLAALLALER